ncbi:hypothetical protein PQX77_008384 [Marasmius sp. AFHP31]|nr:hypothetical protein PQX77_012997 [Marasmius sp. AFHP31]KAK1228519.1 hypothetical protein PQX77_008384 [Marasmius sp. AFHP31]
MRMRCSSFGFSYGGIHVVGISGYSFDSYVAAELISGVGHLFEDLPLGEVDDNKFLKDESFDFDSLPSKISPRRHKDNYRVSEGASAWSPLAKVDHGKELNETSGFKSLSSEGPLPEHKDDNKELKDKVVRLDSGTLPAKAQSP